MIRRKNSNDKECSVESSLEVGMLSKSTFNDQELDNYLRQGEIKACEKPPVPPQILWVGDCTIATFGNFSASTGKAKSKKTFNITAMVAAAVNNYNPQIEMFARFKMKSSFHKTKRII